MLWMLLSLLLPLHHFSLLHLYQPPGKFVGTFGPANGLLVDANTFGVGRYCTLPGEYVLVPPLGRVSFCRIAAGAVGGLRDVPIGHCGFCELPPFACVGVEDVFWR